MIVVDTNIIAYLYLCGERTAQAEKLLRIDSEWTAPRLWKSEMRNILALYLGKGLLSLQEAQSVMRESSDLMRDREYDVVSFLVLNLVASSSCSAYDCEFVALAQELEKKLVTVDKKILQEFPATAVRLDVFVRE